MAKKNERKKSKTSKTSKTEEKTEHKRSRGSKRLAVWMSSAGHTQASLASRIGCGQASVHRWIWGKSAPDRGYALALERLAGIDPEAWA